MFLWSDAVRSVVVLAVPIALGVTTHLVSDGVFVSIGALNVLLVQVRGSARERLARSLWALGLNSGLLLLGTLVGTLGWVEIPLVAVVLTVVHLANRIPSSANLSMVASAMFVIGVGLPGGSVPAALDRGELALVGGGLAVVGLVAHLLLLRGMNRPWPDRDPSATALAVGELPEWPHALAVGVTAAVGLALALEIGLARDYWVMLTVVVVLRARYSDTLETGVARVVGTVIGAALGAGITLSLVPAPVQGILLLAFAFLFFAVQRVNYLLYSIGLTVFVIVLLNLDFPAGVVLAETRVLDTIVGGALASAVAALLWYAHYRPAERAARPPLFGDER